MLSSSLFHNPNRNIKYNGLYLALNFTNEENKKQFLKKSNLVDTVLKINSDIALDNSSDESSDSDMDATEYQRQSKHSLKLEIFKKTLSEKEQIMIIEAIKSSDFFTPSEIRILQAELKSGKTIEDAELKQALYILRHR